MRPTYKSFVQGQKAKMILSILQYDSTLCSKFENLVFGALPGRLPTG
jgi:hypothetical protein